MRVCFAVHCHCLLLPLPWQHDKLPRKLEHVHNKQRRLSCGTCCCPLYTCHLLVTTPPSWMSGDYRCHLCSSSSVLIFRRYDRQASVQCLSLPRPSPVCSVECRLSLPAQRRLTLLRTSVTHTSCLHAHDVLNDCGPDSTAATWDPDG